MESVGHLDDWTTAFLKGQTWLERVAGERGSVKGGWIGGAE